MPVDPVTGEEPKKSSDASAPGVPQPSAGVDDMDTICDYKDCGRVISGPHTGERALAKDFSYVRHGPTDLPTLGYKGGRCFYGDCGQHEPTEGMSPSERAFRNASTSSMMARAASGRICVARSLRADGGSSCTSMKNPSAPAAGCFSRVNENGRSP